MGDELTIGAALLTGCGLIAVVLRRWLRSFSAERSARAKALADARIAESKAMERINETAVRAVDAIVENTRSLAQAIARQDELRDEMRDLARTLDKLVERMNNFQEFRRRAVYKPDPR